MTNSSVVVLTSQLHVENFAVSVVNSTLFLQNSVTVAANGTFEVSPYTALADDNGTTIPQHSRGCVNALPNATVLSNISNYLTDSIYDFQSDLRGPRGVDGNKEYSFEFYVRMELNETSTDYFESFFGDITDEIYTGTARDGVATPRSTSRYFEYAFPNQACLSLGHLWVSEGGTFRVMPVEVPPLVYKINDTGALEYYTSNTTSTREYLSRFNDGTSIGIINQNYSNAIAKRDIELQTLGMGSQVLLVAHSIIVETGGLITASGMNPSRNQGLAQLNANHGSYVDTSDNVTDKYDRYSFGYAVEDDVEASPTLFYEREGKRTSDGHGQPSDGVSGGGGGGNAGAGTPGRLSHDTRWMQSGDDRRTTPQNSGGYGGLFSRCTRNLHVACIRRGGTWWLWPGL